MSSSAPKTQQPDSHFTETLTDPSVASKTGQESTQSQVPSEGSRPETVPVEEEQEADDDGEEGEEEGECGFCLFMKAGGCKDQFIAWEDCIKEGEKNNENIVDKCFEVTKALKICMEAHADYYEPLLRAEKAAEEEARKEFEKETAEGENVKQEGSKKTADSEVKDSN